MSWLVVFALSVDIWVCSCRVSARTLCWCLIRLISSIYTDFLLSQLLLSINKNLMMFYLQVVLKYQRQPFIYDVWAGCSRGEPSSRDESMLTFEAGCSWASTAPFYRKTGCLWSSRPLGKVGTECLRFSLPSHRRLLKKSQTEHKKNIAHSMRWKGFVNRWRGLI